MLLDDSSGGSVSSFNRWPQAVLIAAIVLLTLGLGVVIVAMLRPPNTGKMMSLAKSPVSASSQPSTESASDKPQAVATAAPVAAAPSMDAAPAGVGAMPPAPMMPSIASKNVATERLPILKQDLNELSADNVESKLLSAGYAVPSNQQTVCLVISSDSPAETGEQVRGFFTRHDLILDQPLADRFAFANNRQAAPTSRESILVQQKSMNISAADAVISGRQNSMLGNQQLRLPQSTMPTTAPSQQIFVSHGLTPLQLELLSASLATNNSNQNLKRITLSEAPATRPVLITNGSIIKGQMLSVTIPQLVGPGIEKTNIVKVADDGTISLPMIDPLPASGATPTELEQRIASRYREASLIPQATVRVEVPATTQPSTRPASQPSTTMPTTQATAPEPGINVVVLVESSAK